MKIFKTLNRNLKYIVIILFSVPFCVNFRKLIKFLVVHIKEERKQYFDKEMNLPHCNQLNLAIHIVQDLCNKLAAVTFALNYSHKLAYNVAVDA